MIQRTIALCWLLASGTIIGAAPIELTVDTEHPGAPIDLTKYALGQGGLSDQPMIDAHTSQLAQLHPQTIRIFVQEFFDLLPEPGHYHWNTLDKALEAITATGAKPLMCLCFKPKVLFPKIDQWAVQPNDYAKWEELISTLVKHCNTDKQFGIQYWEIGNEVDIGEDGGCPYRFEAPDYVPFYVHTANAILRADKNAKIGGPALAGYNSDIGTLLINACGKGDAPLDFFSWHIYHSDPEYFRKSIRDVKAKLARFPKLNQTETIIDEWNMALDNPNLAPAFQPAFVMEVTRIFLEENLSRSAYYHIRDWFVDRKQFAKFMSPAGADLVARWWNETPQYDGLWDNQGRVRPAYDAFKLLSLLRGERLDVNGTNSEIKALAAADKKSVNVVLWNYSPKGQTPVEIALKTAGKQSGSYRVYRLNAEAAVNTLELLRQDDAAELENKPIDESLRRYEIRWINISH